MSISKFSNNGFGSRFNVNDFSKLHRQLKSIEQQVNKNENDPNVTCNEWLLTKEKLLGLKCQYDVLMYDNQKDSSRSLTGRVSNYNKDRPQNLIQQTQENRLSVEQLEIEENKNPRIDFGFLRRYEAIADKVRFIIDSHQMNKPMRLDFSKAAEIFLKWYPEFRYKWEFMTALTVQIDAWHSMESAGCYIHPGHTLESIILSSCETETMSSLLDHNGFGCLHDIYRDKLNITINTLNKRSASRIDDYEETNFTPFVKEKIKELKDEVEKLYWSKATVSLGALRVDLERWIANLNCCLRLLENAGSDMNSIDALKKEIFQIGHKIYLTVNSTIPYLLREQMRLSSEKTQELNDNSAEIQELKTLMKDLDASSFEDLIRNFYMTHGNFGNHETSYLESCKNIKPAPLKTITFFKEGKQESQKISLEMRSFDREGVEFDTVDPRFHREACKIRKKGLQHMLKMEDIKDYQVTLKKYLKKDLSKATREAAMQLSCDMNTYYLKLLQKEPLILKSNPDVKSIEATILEREGFSPEQNQAALRLAHEMLVAYFLTEFCCLSLDGPDHPPYLLPSGEIHPHLSTLFDKEAPKFSIFVHVAYLQIMHYSDIFACHIRFFEHITKNVIGLKSLDPEYSGNAIQHLQRLDSKMFGFNDPQSSLEAYLEEVRTMQIKGKLGNIGFHIQVFGQGVEYNLAMNLQISEGNLTEINLLNPYNLDEQMIICGSTKQISDSIFPGIIQDLSNRLNNGAPLKVSFTPFCNKQQYELFCSAQKRELSYEERQPEPSPVALPSAATNRPEYTEVIEFPREIYGDNIVTVRGNITGVLNWDNNPPLTIRNGNYVFEIPHGQYAEQEYKFVLLVPGREPIWEDLQGNRKLSDNRSELPSFKF